MGEGTDVQRALALLSAYSMITLDAETVSVHRLVQAVARTVSATDPHRTAEAVERYWLLAAELLRPGTAGGRPERAPLPRGDLAEVACAVPNRLQRGR